jgi:ribosomal-protein-alanine N-acetyltransferase
MFYEIPVDDIPGYVLSRPSEEDKLFLRSLVQHPELMSTQGGVFTEKQTDEFISYVFSHWEKHGFGHYILRYQNDCIGVIGLKSLTTHLGTKYDLGFTVFPDYQRKGVATRAAQTLLHFAFQRLGISSVSAMSLPGNPAGTKVLIKLGFRQIGETSLEYSWKYFDNVRVWQLDSHEPNKNEDYYYENGFQVFTEKYHLKRGSCCNNNCRHCPWK